MKIGLGLIGISLVILAGCASPSSGGGGSNATKVVKGTIQVADSSYWSNIKIGVFSGGSSGAYPNLNTDTTVTYPAPAVGTYQVIDFNANNGTDVPVMPLATTSFTASGLTSRSYSIELPSAVPGANIKYYFAAWYDTNNDGNLDLKDAVVGNTSYPPTEFNRAATKATSNNGTPTTITITDFQQSQDTNGNYTGKYKYVGYDDNAYNELNDLDTTNNSNFNFNVSATSGW